MIRRAMVCAMLAAALAGAADFRLKDDRGRTTSLAQYKGKVVLLNFWATWCHGCVREIPWFMEFQDRYKRDGLVVLGVSMDENGWKAVRPYMKQRKLNYHLVIGSGELGRQFGLDGMPMTLLIGRDGKVSATHTGVVDREATGAELRALLGRR
ncbi:MAG TPA: TlpA disulfide reductase family protein [Candidatus Sulfopaludibacter sp.]|nr:TlpA disulfide reductase family protein [Candidatus Sulfopaludibacter sp.]